MKCPYCGAEANSKFCGNCGASLDIAGLRADAAHRSTAAPMMQKCKKPIYKKWWFWVIISVLAVILLDTFISLAENSRFAIHIPSVQSQASQTNQANYNSAASTPTSSSKPTASNKAAVSSKATASGKAAASSKPAQQVATYQSILDTYSAKLREATPGLIEEYQREAAKNTNGLEGLAEISNNKISKLAEISNEGIGEMAKIMLTTGSGKYSEYEEWAGKLQDVYMEEAGKISDAYMASAMG